MKTKAKLIKRIIFIVIFFLVILLFTNKVQAKSYVIENMDIQASIQKDGTVEVSHTLTYKFNGEYNGIFINIPYDLKDEEYDKIRKQTSGLNDSLYNAKGVEILEVSQIHNDTNIKYEKVSSAQNGERGVYQITPNNGVYNIKIYSPSSNQKKTFNIKYNLKNLCVRHNDIGELYYNFIGGGWETTIEKLNIDILLPNNTDEKLYVFGHGPYNGVSRIISKNRVNFKVENVRPKQYVATRVMFSLLNIPNTSKKSNINALSLILADENRIIENKEQKNKFTIKVIIFACILLVYWLVLILIYEKDKKYKVVEITEDELFEKYNPLLAGCIEGSRTILARDIIAVILNLINKKIIKLELKNTLRGKDNYLYLISKTEDAENKMDKIETYVYNWIFEKQGGVVELNKRLKELPKEKDANRKFKTLNDIAGRQLESMGANKQKVPVTLRVFNVVLFIISIIITIIHIQYNGFNIYMPEKITSYLGVIFIFCLTMFPIIMAIILMFLKIIIGVRHKVNKVTQKYTGKRIVTTTIAILLIEMLLIVVTNILKIDKYIIADQLLICIALIIMLTDNLMLKNDPNMIEDFSKLNALKDKIQDYTLINTRDIEQITLWEKYLTYAISFGIAEKIMKRIKGLNLDDDLNNLIQDVSFYNYITSDYYTFYTYASLDRVFLRSYEKEVGKAISIMGSSMSGGGFSSGSRRWLFRTDGGFSGGGGSGRRTAEHFS